MECERNGIKFRDRALRQHLQGASCAQMWSAQKDIFNHLFDPYIQHKISTLSFPAFGFCVSFPFIHSVNRLIRMHEEHTHTQKRVKLTQSMHFFRFVSNRNRYSKWRTMLFQFQWLSAKTIAMVVEIYNNKKHNESWNNWSDSQYKECILQRKSNTKNFSEI